MKTPILILIALFMVSCQTVNIAKEKNDCSTLDWFEIGRADGVVGVDSLNWQNKEKSCQNFTDSHHESYVNGWYAGVNEFCSSSHGFAYGKTGASYNNVCPTGKEEAFMDAYKKGVKVFEYESANQLLSREIQELSNTDTSDPQKAPVALKRMNELETQMEFNKALISEINREMAESSSQKSTL